MSSSDVKRFVKKPQTGRERDIYQRETDVGGTDPAFCKRFHLKLFLSFFFLFHF